MRTQNSLHSANSTDIPVVDELVKKYSCKLEAFIEEGHENNSVTRACLFIRNNFNQPISVAHVSRVSNLSVSRLAYLFKRETGMSPMQLRNALRISQACQLLISSSTRISVIAEKVGYADQLYFSRVFKGKVGCAPSKYRKAYRQCSGARY